MTQDELKRWMEAEGEGRLDEADQLFGALFAQHVPVLAPPSAFADRVAREAFAARASSPWAWRSVRLGTGVAAAVMGLVLSVVLTLDPFAVLEVSVGRAAGLLADARAVLQAGLASAVTAWTLAASLGRATLVASSSGLVPFVLVANLLLALVSWYGLTRLLAPREECL